MFWLEVVALAALWFCTGYLVGQARLDEAYSEILDRLFEETEDDDA